MTEVILRRATTQDEELFVRFALELSKFNRSHENETDDFDMVLKARQEQAIQTFKELNDNDFLVFAELEGKVIGYVLANVHYPDPSYTNGTSLTGLLDEIYVLDKARGHKVGKKLMDAAIEWIKSKGATRVKLHMYQWNMEMAGQFYEKEGFKTYAVSMMKELS